MKVLASVKRHFREIADEYLSEMEANAPVPPVLPPDYPGEQYYPGQKYPIPARIPLVFMLISPSNPGGAARAWVLPCDRRPAGLWPGHKRLHPSPLFTFIMGEATSGEQSKKSYPATVNSSAISEATIANYDDKSA